VQKVEGISKEVSIFADAEFFEVVERIAGEAELPLFGVPHSEEGGRRRQVNLLVQNVLLDEVGRL
jgi:hypothetical protein